MNKIGFGKFEEVSETKTKVSLEKIFSTLEIPTFDSVFIAYPHQCYAMNNGTRGPYWSYYPAASNEKTLEFYFWSLPPDFIGPPETGFVKQTKITVFGDIHLETSQKDRCDVKAPLKNDMIFLTDASGTHIALVQNNRVFILFDVYHEVNETAEKFMLRLINLLQDYFSATR